MDIAFHSRALRNICESEDMLKRHFGEEVGEKAKRRLADLRAAMSMRDLAVGNPRELSNVLHPTICIDLADGYRLHFCANHLKAPLDGNGHIDWSAVFSNRRR